MSPRLYDLDELGPLINWIGIVSSHVCGVSEILTFIGAFEGARAPISVGSALATPKKIKRDVEMESFIIVVRQCESLSKDGRYFGLVFEGDVGLNCND